MMDFSTAITLLLVGHALCDFSLQGDYIAINKFPVLNGEPNPVWVWVMSAHCMIHMIPVILITGDTMYAWFMFLTHFIIDYLKCKDRISYNMDQVLHIVVLMIIAGSFTLH